MVIVGGYSDSYLFYNTEVTTREIIGLVLAGNLQSSSVIITGGTKMESTDNLYDSIHRLDSSSVPKEDSFSLMFLYKVLHRFISIDMSTYIQFYTDFDR